MGRACSIKGCNKKPRVACLVSHANNRVKRWVYPNVHVMRYIYNDDQKGKVHRGSVCTKCIKAGKVRKVVNIKMTPKEA